MYSTAFDDSYVVLNWLASMQIYKEKISSRDNGSIPRGPGLKQQHGRCFVSLEHHY